MVTETKISHMYDSYCTVSKTGLMSVTAFPLCEIYRKNLLSNIYGVFKNKLRLSC